MNNRIEEAFETIDRANFLPAGVKNMADYDAALPIGHGQTNSQPYTVRLMLEWLDPQPGDKILDVGSGSGWTTALLAYLVGPQGRIYAVERVPELVDFGRENAERASLKNVEFHPAGEEFGLPDEAPFDRILVSATADELPAELVGQLKIGGPSTHSASAQGRPESIERATGSGQAKMVIPVHNDILEITKKSKNDLDIKRHGGFVFVPLL